MCGQSHRHRERRSGRGRDVTRTTFAADDKRASDAERDEVVSDLRAHAAEGRLTVEELDQRIAAALAAKTRADLAKLLDDLPRRRRERERAAEHRGQGTRGEGTRRGERTAPTCDSTPMPHPSAGHTGQK